VPPAKEVGRQNPGVPTSKQSIADELRADARFADVLDAISEVDDPGEPVFVVGGAVRDALLGHPSYDLDLVVEGDVPAFAKRLAERLGGRVQTHAAFGTAEVFYEGGEIDLATARTETYSRPAALPEVQFATLEEDLARRDFTINAIAASLCKADFGRLIDPHDGRADLEEQTIRVLHARSFLDDPTRIFRAVRYENRLGFRMDEQTEALARAALEQSIADHVSGERLRDELEALLDEDDVAHTIERLGDLDAARAFHATVATDAQTVELAGRVVALARELGVEVPRWRLRLAVLFRRTPPDDLPAALDALAVPRRDEEAVADAVVHGPRLVEELQGAPDPAAVVARVEPLAPDAPLMALALGDVPALHDWFTRLRAVRLEITGADLAALGLAESPRVGEVLAELRRRKLRGDLDGRESELAAARELIG
jgi:tRNA nucleotidyltransferase (CCA-adding enzyme)